jgi:hypothetical protein
MKLKAIWISYRLHRLEGYGWFEACVSILANRVCGTPMYWYPKRARKSQKEI